MKRQESTVSPEACDPVEESPSDKGVYRFTWSWHVELAHREFARQLFRAWMRKTLPVRSLQVHGCAPHEVAVTLEVEAADLGSAVADWSNFPYEAMKQRDLDIPDGASLLITSI